MIIVYEFASGSSDTGHAAISFTKLGKKDFAISYMNEPSKNPTWHKKGETEFQQDKSNLPGFSGTKNWKMEFFAKRGGGAAYPHVWNKASILTYEDFPEYQRKGLKWVLSEYKVYQWWTALIQKREKGKFVNDMALMYSDCTAPVYEALKNALIGGKKFEDFNIFKRMFAGVPVGEVILAEHINETFMKENDISPETLKELQYRDKMWRYANCKYDFVEDTCDNRKEALKKVKEQWKEEMAKLDNNNNNSNNNNSNNNNNNSNNNSKGKEEED